MQIELTRWTPARQPNREVLTATSFRDTAASASGSFARSESDTGYSKPVGSFVYVSCIFRECVSIE